MQGNTYISNMVPHIQGQSPGNCIYTQVSK